ncbi:CPBP family intramembrane glutamic endopeptidase [Chitinophaga filiformis]|uniref:CPBP family intramembrane glutamic endopeptidase n=1 Tax=Chitinophaga filiformis TaxID=104663 RepID=UPI0015A04225|nr:CPBP family intramembrane glutamic endopeptidase [Chitinophaga filiformis]
MTDLQNADLSLPAVSLTWKIFAFLDPVSMYLIPAILFVRITSPQPVEWLKLNKSIQLWPALFIILIMVLGQPIAGILYDWNYTWGMAQSSVQKVEDTAAISEAITKADNFAFFLINLLVFGLVPAIARECFFRGVLQQVFIKMMPKAPWLAIVITSVIFGASYVQWQWFVPVIFVGIQLGTIYYLTGNLKLAILGDFIFGSVNLVESYSRQLGWTTEDPLRPSATHWYTALICLIVTIGLVWYFRKRIPKPVAEIAYQEDIESIGK